MVPTPSFNDYVGVEYSVRNDYGAHNYVDATTPLEFPQSLANNDYLNPPAANLNPINAPTLDGLCNIPEYYEYSWPLVADESNNIIDDWTYNCFSQEGQLANEIRALVPIAPKLPTVDIGTTSSEMPPLRDSNNSPPLILQKKRKRYDEEGREKVKKLRRLGACFRCKIYKLSVGKRFRFFCSMTETSG